MSQEDRSGKRDRTYSAWHRRLSTRRFVGIEHAQLLAMIDLDAVLYVEYDDGSKDPLVLIETARDVGQSYKTATVTTNFAKRTFPVVPAYVLLYTVADQPNPAASDCFDIVSFRAKRLWPDPEKSWTTYTPAAWARLLLGLRQRSAQALDEDAATPPVSSDDFPDIDAFLKEPFEDLEEPLDDGEDPFHDWQY
jgi:hypothetical protein